MITTRGARDYWRHLGRKTRQTDDVDFERHDHRTLPPAATVLMPEDARSPDPFITRVAAASAGIYWASECDWRAAFYILDFVRTIRTAVKWFRARTRLEDRGWDYKAMIDLTVSFQ